VTVDDGEAVIWYRRAATQGHAKAQHNLGLMYLAGEGVLQSNDEAAKWFGLAARQGFAAAMGMLEYMRSSGFGAPQTDV
jgi:TPR repeat protein